jgi:hypothetical protein
MLDEIMIRLITPLIEDGGLRANIKTELPANAKRAESPFTFVADRRPLSSQYCVFAASTTCQQIAIARLLRNQLFETSTRRPYLSRSASPVL